MFWILLLKCIKIVDSLLLSVDYKQYHKILPFNPFCLKFKLAY